MRESFKKAKVKEGFMAFRTIRKLPCGILWSKWGGEDYLGHLSLLAFKALENCVLFFTTWNSFSWPVFLTVLINLSILLCADLNEGGKSLLSCRKMEIFYLAMMKSVFRFKIWPDRKSVISHHYAPPITGQWGEKAVDLGFVPYVWTFLHW